MVTITKKRFFREAALLKAVQLSAASLKSVRSKQTFEEMRQRRIEASALHVRLRTPVEFVWWSKLKRYVDPEMQPAALARTVY